MEKLVGIGVSPGIAIGKAYLRNKELKEHQRSDIMKNQVEAEITRLKQASRQVKEDLVLLIKSASEKIGLTNAEIFNAHLLILDDPEFIPQVISIIDQEKVDAVTAINKVVKKYSLLFSQVQDEYIRTRISDVEDVAGQIKDKLLRKDRDKTDFTEPVILLADDLTPSETVLMDPDMLLGFAAAGGSKTSHTAIIARCLEIPAVVGVGEVLLSKENDSEVTIIDGDNGIIILNPTPSVLDEYNKKQESRKQLITSLNSFKNRKAATVDGRTIEVAGNMGNLGDLNRLLEQGSDGVGLFRTEFLYMEREKLPSEEEQFIVYREIALKMAEKPVIIRTLDIGGDKNIPYLGLPAEPNPFLGYRATRMYFNRPEIYKAQLRAILRAAFSGNIKIMFPMISSVQEVRKAHSIIREVKAELIREGHDFSDIEVGIMVEIPSAAIIADVLADEVDFFSIGTNDLVQYTLAADRTNKSVSDLYSHYHPAVLKLISLTVEAAHSKGIWVGLCGEAAADPLLIPFFIGVGLDEISVSAGSILRTKRDIGKWTVTEAMEITHKLLRTKSVEEVEFILSNSSKE
ncbi:MAG: phosphoenolpyruvate--protein phosphotransferase [Bacillota bacterium]